MVILPGNIRLSDEVLVEMCYPADSLGGDTIAEQIENIESEYGLDAETVIRLVTGAPHLPLNMPWTALDCFLRLNETATLRMEEERIYANG